MYSTEEAVKVLKGPIGTQYVFNNVDDNNIHIFLCRDDSIGLGEYGNGAVITFNPGDYKYHNWLISQNKFQWTKHDCKKDECEKEGDEDNKEQRTKLELFLDTLDKKQYKTFVSILTDRDDFTVMNALMYGMDKFIK